MIVSNATPLIAFARIGELTLLERIVEQLILPQAVWQEVTGVSDRPGAETIREASWIDVQSVSEVPADLLTLLDRGEAEVIILAEELGADEVLLDERAARAIAITRGLSFRVALGAAGRVRNSSSSINDRVGCENSMAITRGEGIGLIAVTSSELPIHLECPRSGRPCRRPQ